MRIQLTVFCAAVALFYSTVASATTRAQALAMPMGSWPGHFECLKDEQGNLTGYRDEEISVTDAPGQGNVLTRSFRDRTCHN